MEITDTNSALNYLERIGYYRLSGYWYPFRERSSSTYVSDTFKQGSTFKNAVDLYVFDKKLRLLVLDGLERIEVALRVDISHTLGEKDPFAYLKPELFHKKFSVCVDERKGVSKHRSWLNKHEQLIDRSKEKFIDHYKKTYELPVAIWVACEVWDFGTLSMLFNGMKENDQDNICEKYGISNGRIFATWLRSLNYLRNICAHHSRLWNRNIIDQPRLPSKTQLHWIKSIENDNHAKARCFLLLKITHHLLRHINPRSSWTERMKTHLLEFPNLTHLELDLGSMGAQPNWHEDW